MNTFSSSKTVPQYEMEASSKYLDALGPLFERFLF